MSLVLNNNTSFAMKHAELSELMGNALAKNHVLERLELVKGWEDSVLEEGAKYLTRFWLQ